MYDDIGPLREALAARYELGRQLGEGGMASVYLAVDQKHERHVAVKVLKPELAAVIGADRFLHEIKITANLQHPHILPLFDSGQVGSILYFVMPYVSGESLRDKLDRETQLPIPEATRIASEVADALAYAHQHDVIHRDIKPANVLLHEGRALVADFGIALAVTIAGETRLTQTSLSFGTPHYMSPEQIAGDQGLDGRSDVYALGCMTYEMLAGCPPHDGPTHQAVLSSALAAEAKPLRSRRSAVPAHVEATVHSALQKLPADRCPDARAFADGLANRREFASLSGPMPRPRRRLAWGLAASLLGAGGVATLGAFVPRENPEPPTRWLGIALPDSLPMTFQGSGWQELRSLDLSPDGEQLVYAAEEPSGRNRLYVRDLEGPEFRALLGTDGAYNPLYAPDRQWIAFFADGQLRKVSTGDGSVVPLADVQNPAGAAWLSTDEILVSEGNALVRYAASSGARSETPAECAQDGDPCLLPDPLRGSEWVLVSSYDDIALVSLESGERRVLLDGLFEPQARFVTNEYIAYFHRPGQLFVVPFDAGDLAVTGDPVPVIDGVRQGGFGHHLAVADDGTVVFAEGGHSIESELTWVSRDGVEEPLPFDSQAFGVFTLSPDGRYIASTVYRTNAQIWIYDLERPFPRPLVTDGFAQHPVWSPDGSEIAYLASDREAEPPILAIAAGGGGEPRELIESGGYPFSWCEGDFVTFVRSSGVTKSDVWVASVPDADSHPILQSPAIDDAPSFSPDAQWIAYMSGATGRWEVYVEPYPSTGERWQISTAGGGFPRWSPDGTELFYMHDSDLYAVDLTDGPGRAGLPERLFGGPYVQTFGHAFDVSPGGDRFLVLKAADPRVSSPSLTLVQGWLGEVRARVAQARASAE